MNGFATQSPEGEGDQAGYKPGTSFTKTTGHVVYVLDEVGNEELR
jgi:hypothetical protein